MFQNDNWGQLARIGIFIVGNEVVPESEWWAMLPSSVSVHAARITARAPWATWNEDQSCLALVEDLIRGAHQFAAMQLTGVVVAHSSSSFVGGEGWDDAVVNNLSEILRPDTKITTNGLDTVAALRATNVRSPLLVMPPWFNDDTIQAGVGYYLGHGIKPAGCLRYDPGSPWRDFAPGELYRVGMGFAQELEPLHEQIIDNFPTSADGILIAGTGFRCVGILEMLEQKLGCPVLSANQASLWHCLKNAGVHDDIQGYGMLLRALSR
jgi:maleate isomerase